MLTSYVCGARGWMTPNFLAAIAPVWEIETLLQECGELAGKPLWFGFKVLGGSRQPGILLLIRLVSSPLVPTSGLAWSKHRRVMGCLMGR